MPKNLIKTIHSSKNEVFVFIVFLSTLFLLFPPFFHNLPMSGHDFGAHMVHLRIFTDALNQDQFPVRWVEWPQAGQSLPLFVYYQPFIYYFAQLPHIFGANLLVSLNYTTLFLWIFSGFSMFLLVRSITKNNYSGLISASLYIFLPYHIFNIFIRSAYPESAALAFMPLLFYAIFNFIQTKNKSYFALISISIFLILISHPVSFMIFISAILSFTIAVIIITQKEHKSKSVILTLGALILGFLLSAFYTFPAIELQTAVNTRYLTGGVYDFRNHFLCFNQLIISAWGTGNSIKGCGDKLSFQLSTISIIILFLTLFLTIYKVSKKDINNLTKYLIFFLIFTFLSLLLCLPPSKFIWENINYFSLIQFPWRFLGLTLFSITILGGILSTFLKLKHNYILFLIILIIIPLLSMQFIKPGWYLPKDFFAQDTTKFYVIETLYQKKNIANMGYMPITVKSLIQPNIVPNSKIKVFAKNSKIEILENNSDKKIYNITSSSSGQAILYIHYFPGWKFFINGQEVKSDYSNKFGFPIINFPSGKNLIIATYSGTDLMKISDFISLFSLIFLLFILLPKEKIKAIFKEFNIFSD